MVKSIQRRQFIKLGSAALAAIPLAVLAEKVSAATNATMRAALKYQDKPEGDKQCSGCAQFVPGETPQELGGCKIIPGDTEISPQGYCTAWTKK